MENNLSKRNEIINILINTLKPLDSIYAMWQCGAAAFNRIDQCSDIDIVIDVDDNMVVDIFDTIDSSLEKISHVEYTHECELGVSPGSHQKIYKLRDINKFLIIEITALKHSSSYKLLEREVHGDVLVEFDKTGITRDRNLDKNSLLYDINRQINLLEHLFNIKQCLVEKELNRKNYIEAISFYNNFSVGLLVDALRIKYSPYKYGFETRHIYYDLPKNTLERLEPFYFIKDVDDLKKKNMRAKSWFNDVIEEIKQIRFENTL